jgi:hypothetical protein
MSKFFKKNLETNSIKNYTKNPIQITFNIIQPRSNVIYVCLERD